MNNIKLEKTKKGWFLTIGESSVGVENRWAVTSLELWVLKKLIEDNIHEIMEEVDEK